MKQIVTYFNKPFFKHLLFWIVVFLYFVLSVSNLSYYVSFRHLMESYGLIVCVQIITAYTCIYVLMPKFLNQKKVVVFVVTMVFLLMCMYALYTAVRTYYIDVEYFELYDSTAKEYAKTPYWERMSSLSVWLSKLMLYLTPTALLLMSRFYRNQQQFLKVNEQKKIAELNALKQQLNPHFLFNTLNNLYALAIEKSAKTPEVIERLSDILDYMLYRCNDQFVSLQKEVELIKNYLALEKIRYGTRVSTSFDNQTTEDAKIAPLLLLTFVENAFKHGVSQELHEAQIKIVLVLEKNEIVFSVRNTKPTHLLDSGVDRNEASLGLKNVKKQLELLYPNAYKLKFEDLENSYFVQLKLRRR